MMMKKLFEQGKEMTKCSTQPITFHATELFIRDSKTTTTTSIRLLS